MGGHGPLQPTFGFAVVLKPLAPSMAPTGTVPSATTVPDPGTGGVLQLVLGGVVELDQAVQRPHLAEVLQKRDVRIPAQTKH